MDKKLKRKSWRTFFIQSLLFTCLFFLLFGYFQCSGFKPTVIKSSSAAAAGGAGKEGAKGGRAELKSFLFLKGAVCPVYQQFHSTAVYKAADNTLRTVFRQTLKNQYVVDARISWQKWYRNARNSRVYQSVKVTVDEAYIKLEPIVGEAWVAFKSLSFKALKALVKAVPVVVEKIPAAWNSIASSQPVQDFTKYAQAHYKNRVEPIYKESVAPLINQAFVKTGVSATLSQAYAKVQEHGAYTSSLLSDVFEDELEMIQNFYKSLLKAWREKKKK